MVFASGAIAQSPQNVPPLRLCTEADLSGVYKLIDLKETPPSQEASWYHDYPYQYITFLPNHMYNFIATKHSINRSDELNKAMDFQESQGFHQVKKYTLDTKGELDLYLGDRVDYYYRCIINVKDTVTSKRGDMTLMGYSKTRSALNKIFRPWH
jgi:hypothetical protein